MQRSSNSPPPENPDLGLRNYSREDLEAAVAPAEMLRYPTYMGLATIAADVTPELARATIASVVVLGAFALVRSSRRLSQ